MTETEGTPERIATMAARWVARRDAGLSPAEEVELKRWQAADERHAAALEHFSAAWRALDRPGCGTAPATVLAELGQRAAHRRRRRALGGAAAALLVALGVMAWREKPIPDASPAVAARRAGLVPGPEQRTLPDGSVVELKSGAEIAVDFAGPLRRVALRRGEAHFQVAKNPARPFAVEVAGVQVRAVGTAFSVQLGSGQVEVLVTEGRIAVEPLVAADPAVVPAGGERGAPQTASALAQAGAGERVVLPLAAAAAAPAVTAVTADEMRARLAWRAPRVEFSDTPLGEAVELMNRARPESLAPLRLTIDPRSPGLTREPVSGVFRADNAEAFVRMLELSLGLEARRADGVVVLRKVP